MFQRLTSTLVLGLFVEFRFDCKSLLYSNLNRWVGTPPVDGIRNVKLISNIANFTKKEKKNHQHTHKRWCAQYGNMLIIFWLRWVKEDDLGATSVSFHSNCEILRALSLVLKTDCSCCKFSFMRSGTSPGTLFFMVLTFCSLFFPLLVHLRDTL